MKMAAMLEILPRTNNINAHSSSNFHSSYHTLSKNHCFSTFHVLFICGCGLGSLPACMNYPGLASFKPFHPLEHTSLQQTVPSALGIQLSTELCPFRSFPHQITSLVQTSKAAVISTHHDNMAQITIAKPHSQHTTICP